jgi:polyisoprenoid-binding protein YceI
VVRRPLKAVLVLVAAAIVLVVGGFVLYLTVLRDDPPDRLALTPESSSSDAPASGTPEGQWVVRTGDDSVVGYRVHENLAGISQEAAGRTHDVSGSLTVDSETSISAGQVRAGLQSLKSDEDRRDNAIRSRGLETDTFPEATFELTGPLQLPSPPKAGQEVAVTASGNLTLHGVTKPVQVPVKARWDGRTIQVAGSVGIAFADAGIDPPNVGGFVSVDDHGELELRLTFVPA